jgi:hypothetical protein
MYPERIFLDVIGTKVLTHLRLSLHAINSHQRILLPTMVFWDSKFLHQQLKVGEGVGSALVTLSLCFSLNVALYFLFSHITYIKNTFVPHKTTIKCIGRRKT